MELSFAMIGLGESVKFPEDSSAAMPVPTQPLATTEILEPSSPTSMVSDAGLRFAPWTSIPVAAQRKPCPKFAQEARPPALGHIDPSLSLTLIGSASARTVGETRQSECRGTSHNETRRKRLAGPAECGATSVNSYWLEAWTRV